MKKIIIASTSTLHDGAYLEYLLPELKTFFKQVKTLVFIPFARPSGISHQDYTAKVQVAFSKIGIEVKGLHEFEDPLLGIREAEAVFTGGGNTFLLVKQLYDHGLMQPLIEVVKSGTPYLGTSAGSNICGLTMETTNDMPIIYPPSFQTLGLVPFNINPHYLDPDPHSKHMGETRETRIHEFHQFNSQPVIGLREGSWIEVLGDRITLKGQLPARIFRKNQLPEEIETASSLSNFN